MLRVDSGEIVRAVIADVSLGGLQARTRCAIGLNEFVRVTIGRDAAQPLKLDAYVKYVIPLDHGFYGVGLEFALADDIERAHVARFVKRTADRFLRSLSA